MLPNLDDLRSLRDDLDRELVTATDRRDSLARDVRLGRAEPAEFAVADADVRAREIELAQVVARLAEQISESGQARRRREIERCQRLYGELRDASTRATASAALADAAFDRLIGTVVATTHAQTEAAVSAGLLFSSLRPNASMDEGDVALANLQSSIAPALAWKIQKLLDAVPDLANYCRLDGLMVNHFSPPTIAGCVGTAAVGATQRMNLRLRDAGIEVPR